MPPLTSGCREVHSAVLVPLTTSNSGPAIRSSLSNLTPHRQHSLPSPPLPVTIQVVSSLLAAVFFVVAQGAGTTTPSVSVAGSVTTFESVARSVCLGDSNCFPVRSLNDTSDVKRLALESQTRKVEPQALYLCFDTALEHCAVKVNKAAPQDDDDDGTARSAQLESIGCISVPWGMLYNGMS